jgi:hypothetical protein
VCRRGFRSVIWGRGLRGERGAGLLRRPWRLGSGLLLVGEVRGGVLDGAGWGVEPWSSGWMEGATFSPIATVLPHRTTGVDLGGASVVLSMVNGLMVLCSGRERTRERCNKMVMALVYQSTTHRIDLTSLSLHSAPLYRRIWHRVTVVLGTIRNCNGGKRQNPSGLSSSLAIPREMPRANGSKGM